MLIRTDPFRDLDRLAQQLSAPRTRPAAMPMDAWRDGDRFIVAFDLPGVDPSSVDIDVERNVLTVKAERLTRFPSDVQLIVSERPRGVFSRQVILGDALDRTGSRRTTRPASCGCRSRWPRRPSPARSWSTPAARIGRSSTLTADRV